MHSVLASLNSTVVLSCSDVNKATFRQDKVSTKAIILARVFQLDTPYPLGYFGGGVESCTVLIERSCPHVQFCYSLVWSLFEYLFFSNPYQLVILNRYSGILSVMWLPLCTVMLILISFVFIKKNPIP